MIEIFDTQQEYNVYTSYNTCLQSDRLYYIKENGDTHFFTNNIDGEAKVYDKGNIPEGNITITENGNNFDVFSYATASVAVPLPEGNITLTENGNNFDVFSYATASVNVPQPSGNITITNNGENIDVYSYATATVNVPEQYKDNLINLIERDITSFEIPSGTTKIGITAFYQSINLTSVIIPSTVTTIGDSAFRLCTSLNNVIIHSGVTRINSMAFRSCTSLTSFTIPDSVTGMENMIFDDCTNLKTITSLNTTPPYFYSTSENLPNTIETIYVPAGSVDAYKAARGWSSFADKIQAIP